MLIADFFHFENLPERDFEDYRFCKILDVVKMVGSGFIIQIRKKIACVLFSISFFFIKYTNHIIFLYTGELINVNVEKHMPSNRRVIMAQAPMFGFDWLGDSVTIGQMPLLNMMVMCGDGFCVYL